MNLSNRPKRYSGTDLYSIDKNRPKEKYIKFAKTDNRALN